MKELVVKNPEGNCGVASERMPDLLLRTLKETFEAYDRNYKELEDRLNEAKKVIEHYADPVIKFKSKGMVVLDHWEHLSGHIELLSKNNISLVDPTVKARDLLEKWGTKV